MNNSIMASEFGLNKIEKAFLFSLLVSVVTIVAVGKSTGFAENSESN